MAYFWQMPSFAHNARPAAADVTQAHTPESLQREYRGHTGAQPRFHGAKPRRSPSFGVCVFISAVPITKMFACGVEVVVQEEARTADEAEVERKRGTGKEG